MPDLLDMLNLRWDHLLARPAGPLHFRFLMMPTVVTILAIRAGLRDAQEIKPGFVWALLTRRADRPQLLRSALKDIGRILIVALVLDTTYQIIVLKTVYPGEALLVAIVSAVVPYVVFRGPISLLARYFRKRMGGASAAGESSQRS
jgi:hypothetical protein